MNEEGTKLAISPEEASVRLGVARSTLYKLLADGAIKSFKIGRSRRISIAALQTYIAEAEAADA